MFHFDHGGEPRAIRTHVLHHEGCPLGGVVADIEQIISEETEANDNGERARIEEAADRALRTEHHVVVDGFIVVPDTVIAKIPRDADWDESQTFRLRRDADGRLVYLFKAPPGWTA